MAFGIKSLKRGVKKFLKRANLSKKDIFHLLTATPPANPMRLLDKIGEVTSDPLPEPEKPPEYVAPPFIVDDKTRQRASGRNQTLLTRPSSLSSAPTIRPTLLGR